MISRMGATWIIGDIHGCAATFDALLERIELDRRHDRLVLAGDLVNRGPASMAVLRRACGLAEELGDRFEVVLGNHDIHLLGVAAGRSRIRRGDTLDDVLEAEDAEHLLGWLRSRPLLVEVAGTVVVHAGLHPRWSWDDARSHARRLEARLRDRRETSLLARRSRPTEDQLDLGIFVRLRAWNLERDRPEGGFSGSPEEAPPGCVPWYRAPTARPDTHRIVFGHWAAHGRRVVDGGRIIALDSGCAWGGELSAVRLEDLRLVGVPRLD